MNVKLLKKIRDYIAEHPYKYDQYAWCGTKCCIAGHTVKLSGEKPRAGEVCMDTAKRLLNLAEGQAVRLFVLWPEQFQWGGQEWDKKTYGQRARIAVDRINHFIKTRGAE